MTASGEVRWLWVSREQRDNLADAFAWEDEYPLTARSALALVAAWDAAVPGVVDASDGRWQVAVDLEDLHALRRISRGLESEGDGARLVQLIWRFEEDRVAYRPPAEVPGVVDSSWAAQVRDLLGPHAPRADEIAAAYEIARAAAGGEAAAVRECGVVSNDDGVDYRCTLPVGHDGLHSGVFVGAYDHYRTAGGERPSVSLRETIETELRARGWTPGSETPGGRYWRDPRDGEGWSIGQAVDFQIKREDLVEREAEEGERDE